jgi:hypothetical protein
MIARYNVSRFDYQVEPPLPTPEEPCGNSPLQDFLRPRSRAPKAAYRAQPPSLDKGPCIVVQPPLETVDRHDHEDFYPIKWGKVFMIIRTRTFVQV